MTASRPNIQKKISLPAGELLQLLRLELGGGRIFLGGRPR
jgi:hypothetical protein